MVSSAPHTELCYRAWKMQESSQSPAIPVLGMGWRSSSLLRLPTTPAELPRNSYCSLSQGSVPRHQPPQGFRTTWQHRKTFVSPALCFANQVKPADAHHGLLHDFSRWVHCETRGDPLSWDTHLFVHMVHAAAATPSRATLDQAQSWHLLLKNAYTKEKQSQKIN